MHQKQRNFAPLLIRGFKTQGDKRFSTKTGTTKTTTAITKGRIGTRTKINPPEEEEKAAKVGSTRKKQPRPPLPRSQPKGSAARLPFFVDNWTKVCSNNFILRIVANGYKLQFKSTPSQDEFVPRIMSKSSKEICFKNVKKFLSQGAIKSVSFSSCSFFSNIFPVPKKTLGEFRIIFILLNQTNILERLISYG